MPLRTFRRFAPAAALALALTGCDSATEPEVQEPVDLAIDFCSNDLPVWIAYQNQGEPWTRLTPNAEGTVTFTATNDVALAYVHQSGADYNTGIIFAANTDLEPVSGKSCLEERGAKTIRGTVAGFVSGQLALVTANFSSVYLASINPSFSLTNLADRAVDVIASRVNVSGTTQAADRVIIRRSQQLANNATIPVLDFSSAEAVQPVGFNATLTGVASGDFAFATNNFFSQLETSHVLGHQEPLQNGSVSFPAIPSGLLAAGDYHDLFALAIDADFAQRGVERFFRAPANQTIELGPHMSTITVSRVASSPYLRLRVQGSKQLTYDDALTITYLQEDQLSTREVNVILTRGYGASSQWSAVIPDFSGVSGWQNAWGIVAGGRDVDWTASVYGARPELLFGAAPNDGETVMFANRSSFVDATRASAFGRRATATRRRPFSPGR